MTGRDEPKVRSLAEVEQPADSDVIETLTELMDDAKAGRLRGFLFVGFGGGTSAISAQAGEIECMRVIAACEAIKTKAVREWDL